MIFRNCMFHFSYPIHIYMVEMFVLYDVVSLLWCFSALLYCFLAIEFDSCIHSVCKDFMRGMIRSCCMFTYLTHSYKFTCSLHSYKLGIASLFCFWGYVGDMRARLKEFDNEKTCLYQFPGAIWKRTVTCLRLGEVCGLYQKWDNDRDFRFPN